MTDADALVERSLAFGQQTAVELAIPAGARVVAVLRARAVRQDVLDALGLAARQDEVPTLEIARAPLGPEP